MIITVALINGTHINLNNNVKFIPSTRRRRKPPINATTFTHIHHLPTPKLTHQVEILPQPRKPIIKQTQPIKYPRTKPITTTTTSDVLRLLDTLNVSINLDDYISLIKECTNNRDRVRAVELHNHMIKNRICFSLGLVNRVLIMYASCGCMEYARRVFDEMPVRDCNSWAVMIAGYADNEEYEEAVEFFVLFLLRGHYDNVDMFGFPVSWILVCVLKACVQTLNLEVGKQVHGWLMKSGYVSDLFLSSSLINLYGKSGWLEGADLVFNQTSYRNVVVWTSKLVNNCMEGRFGEVLNVFMEMGKEGVKKNSFTFSSVLRACANMSDDAHCGEQVHANAIKLGLASKSYVQSGLVNMYGKLGLIRDAEKVFWKNGSKRNSACWNAMLSAYIQNGVFIEAIKFLYEMKVAGVEPQEVLVNELRYACGYETLNLGRTGEIYK